jgi:pilus assembly protein CpaE
MRSGVTEFIHIPVVSADLTAAIERIRGRKYMSSPHKPRGKIISFISCKGGSGNTFIAANLGYILAAEHQQKVLMIDLNLQFGDASFYISEEPGPSSLADIVRQAGLDSTVIATAAMQISENFYLLQAPDNAEDSMGIISTHVDNLLTIAAQDYDFVIVDLPRIIDSLAMKALDRADSIFIVMQPLVPYMRALTKMTSLLNKLGCDRSKIKIILNRFNENMDIPQENIADAVQSEIDFTISNDYLAVSKSVNIGKPLALLTHDNPVCSDLRKLATSLDGAVGESSPISFFKKLFGKR